MRLAVLIAAALCAAPAASSAKVCGRWAAAERVGALDARLIAEASGLEASVRYPGRLYHLNDSGDELRFFITDMRGGDTRVVNLKGPKPADMEDMSLGPCGAQTCLVLGDIGDNPAARSEVAFTLVLERTEFDDGAAPLRTVRARYPDGPHNAEAFALHPNGDLFVVTKPSDAQRRTPGPALVYRLSAAQLRETEGVQVFHEVGQIDLALLAPDLPFYARITTGLDITPDGRRAVLLTYGAAFELDVDLAQGLPQRWVAGRTHQRVPISQLMQQEAIAWLPDASGFVYDSEAGRGAPTAPLVKVACAAR